jgi:hypothetical protein
MIYFVQCEQFIKIGYTTGHPIDRLSGLQTSSPFSMRVIFAMDGELRDEDSLHERFKALWVRGEWFNFKDELLEFVEGMVRASGYVALTLPEHATKCRFGRPGVSGNPRGRMGKFRSLRV